MKKFKKGDLVMIAYPPMDGNFAIIIGSGDFGMGIRWLVHLTGGQDLWFPEDEMVMVV